MLWRVFCFVNIDTIDQICLSGLDFSLEFDEKWIVMRMRSSLSQEKRHQNIFSANKGKGAKKRRSLRNELADP